jgi:hypothetical protein
VAWVTPCRATNRDSACGDFTVASSGSSNCAPLASAITHSKVAASKANEANCSTRLAELTPKMRTCSAAMSARPRCSSSEALGLPVEPDV